MHITPKRTQLITAILSNRHNAEYCRFYGERGYTDPEQGIILCNWNNVSKLIQDYLEEAGFELEWSDEWVIDYNNDKAYRTSPDSYGWVSQIAYTEDGEMFTPDDSPSEWIEEFSLTDWNQRIQALPDWITREDIEQEGYKEIAPKVGEVFESGFHAGQDDSPAKIAKQAFEAGASRVVFRISSSEQFATMFQGFAQFDNEQEGE